MASTDTTTEAPKQEQASSENTTTPENASEGNTKKKSKGRKPSNFALGWVTETAPEQDENGRPIPGTERTCIVLQDLPPNLEESDKNSRNAIERATKKAVYELGLEEYGNKRLRVISYGDDFEVPFEKTTITKLMPPSSSNSSNRG